MTKSDMPENARTVRTEWAEWDLIAEVWREPSRAAIEEFRPDGKVRVSESRNPDGSRRRATNLYAEEGLFRGDDDRAAGSVPTTTAGARSAM